MSLVLLAALASAAPLTFVEATTSSVNTTTTQTGRLDKEYAIGDIDNDGDLDVVLAIADGIFGRKQNLVYRNDNGLLTDISLAAVPEFFIDTLSRRPFLKDIDGDGWLDLIVVNDTLASGYAGRTHLWMNNHPGGVFQGFVQDDARLRGGGGASCGAAMTDFDLDGDVDLYIGNYPGPSQDTMYSNDGDGWFTDRTAAWVPQDGDYTTDVVIADFNNDGTPDISLGNHTDPSFIYYNNLRGQGVDGDFSTPGSSQLTRQATRWHNATQPIDVDSDGDIDLYMANYDGEGDVIYRNDGAPTGVVNWTIVPVPGMVSRQETTKPTAVDVDGDGRTDLIVPSVDGRTVVLRNFTEPGGDIRLVDWTQSNLARTESGFTATMFDVNTDGIHDLVLFGHGYEHVYLGSDAPIYDRANLTSLPDTSAGPIVVTDRRPTNTSMLLVSQTPIVGTEMVVVARSCSDIEVSIGDTTGVFARSDDSAFGNEEVASYRAAQLGQLGIRIRVRRACGDVDGDGDTDARDFRRAAVCAANPTPACVRRFDADLDGTLTLNDRALLVADSMGPNAAPFARIEFEVLTR